MQSASTIYVVDDDEAVRTAIRRMCASVRESFYISEYSTAAQFLAKYNDSGESPRCLLLDIQMPEMTGIELQRTMASSRFLIPVILLSGAADVSTAVESLQMGAVDVLQKPVRRSTLIETIERGLALDLRRRADRKRAQQIQQKLLTLTRREREVCELLIECQSVKQIAASLDIGFQSAAKHRANVLRKFDVRSDSELVLMISRESTPVGIGNNGDAGDARPVPERLTR